MPGKVVSYDAAKQVADVRPLLKRAVYDVDGHKSVEELSVIPAVPVVWPRGGGYYLHFPLAAGDGVLLVFCERDPSAALDRDDVADPGDPRRHGLSGAVAIPGYSAVAKRLAGTDALAHGSLGHEGGPRIHFDASEIRLGEATNFVALANLVTARLNAIQAAFDAHTHFVPITGPAGSTPTAPPPVPIGPLAPVAASQVKAL
jgi:hypothetical protein